MANTLLRDDPKTVAMLESIACLFEWTRALLPADRKRFLAKLAECSDAVQQVVIKMLGVFKNPDATPAERQRALMTIADALFINPDETDGGTGRILPYPNRMPPQKFHVLHVKLRR